MRKPISEHSTTIKARKSDDPPRGHDAGHQHSMEPVGGGSVRRVEFEEDRRPVFHEHTDEPSWHPRANDSINDIHFEVDNLHRLRRPMPRGRRATQTPETKRVFETEGGSVKESRQRTSEGERRVLYTSRRQGSVEQDQRFHSGLVDRVIAQRYHDGPQWTEATEDKPRGWLRKRPKPEPAVADQADDAGQEGQEQPAGRKQPNVKASASTKAVANAKAGVKTAEDAYQPQCEAVAASGKQCRNSAKTGSNYCGAHQAHKPRRLEDVLDTLPGRGDDTRPGVGDLAGTGQCAAYTKEGIQCRRNSRTNSKYCATHKGYRQPSKAALQERLDTKPRYAGAKDTRPKLRK